MIDTLSPGVEAKGDIFDAYTNRHIISTDVKEHRAFFDPDTSALFVQTLLKGPATRDRTEITSALLTVKMHWMRSRDSPADRNTARVQDLQKVCTSVKPLPEIRHFEKTENSSCS
ncbi:hypothetical protein MHYP_G00212190 [Metynnis hypsauchen]